MAPKKKGGTKKKVGKKSGGTKGPTIIDGIPVTEMTKDQLEGHVKRLLEEVHKLLVFFLVARIKYHSVTSTQ